MRKRLAVVHHADRRHDVTMPYAPAIVVPAGGLVFVSGVTAAPVYHSHPHRDEEFDLPPTMQAQAELVMENLRKTLAAAGATLADVVSATRYLIDVREQDDLNRVWAAHLEGHLPTTTTVEVSRLATHPRCKLEITAIAVTGAARPRRRSHGASGRARQPATPAAGDLRGRETIDRSARDSFEEPRSPRTSRPRRPDDAPRRRARTPDRRARSRSERA